jgi:hypothetical protein
MASTRFSAAFQERPAMAEESEGNGDPEDTGPAPLGASKRVKTGRSRRKRKVAPVIGVGERSERAEAQENGTTTASEAPIPEPHETKWRWLAALIVSVETFCNEVSHIAERWPGDKRIAEKKRPKAAADVARLVTHGKNVRDSVTRLLTSRPATSPASAGEQLEATWHRLQGIDLVRRLQRIVRRLEGIKERLEEQFSPEVMQQINEDFRSLTAEVGHLNRTATTVRESLQKTLVANPLSQTLKTHLSRLIEAVTTAITGSVKGTSDTWVDHGRFAVRLPERVKRAKAVRDAYDKLLKVFEKECDDHVKAMIRKEKDAAKNLEDFLQSVEAVIQTVRSTAEFAETSEEAAALGIDYRIASESRNLRQQLDSLRLDFSTLDRMFWRYRGIVARAPFKRVQPTRPLPPWHLLKDEHRQIVAVLITLRFDDEHGEMYAVSRQSLEQELGCAANDSSLNRRLIFLDEVYEIVGKYQPIPSVEDQRPGYGYWVEEYAYAKYGPEVLGKAWTPTREA